MDRLFYCAPEGSLVEHFEDNSNQELEKLLLIINEIT